MKKDFQKTLANILAGNAPPLDRVPEKTPDQHRASLIEALKSRGIKPDPSEHVVYYRERLKNPYYRDREVITVAKAHRNVGLHESELSKIKKKTVKTDYPFPKPYRYRGQSIYFECDIIEWCRVWRDEIGRDYGSRIL